MGRSRAHGAESQARRLAQFFRSVELRRTFHVPVETALVLRCATSCDAASSANPCAPVPSAEDADGFRGS